MSSLCGDGIETISWTITISLLGQFVTLSTAKGLESREILRFAQNDTTNWPTTDKLYNTKDRWAKNENVVQH